MTSDSPSPVRASAQEQVVKQQYPIPLNDAQEQAAKVWAADDRLWTTQETVEFNLRVFARVILQEQLAAEARGRQQAEQLPRHHPELEAMDPRNVAFRLWQENEELKARVQQAEQARDRAVEIAAEDCAKLLMRVAALTQALKDYGQHKSGCRLSPSITVSGGLAHLCPPVCTCGLDAALTGAQETTDAGS